jgi:hypothetical protein
MRRGSGFRSDAALNWYAMSRGCKSVSREGKECTSDEKNLSIKYSNRDGGSKWALMRVEEVKCRGKCRCPLPDSCQQSRQPTISIAVWGIEKARR